MASTELLSGEGVTGFRAETADIVTRLRATLNALVFSVAGRPLSKSRDAQRLFDVDVKLSWQLFRTLNGGDPFEAVAHIPAGASFLKLLKQAKLRAVNKVLVDDVENAYNDFERLIERHAGDRVSFAQMLEAGSRTRKDELDKRASIFDASRHIWGVEKAINLNVTLLHPAAGYPQNHKFDVITLAAVRGFLRWRTDAPVLLFKHKLSSSQRNAHAEIQPLDRESFDALKVPLLDRFCSNPRPSLRTRQLDNGVMLTELTPDAVGRLNSMDVTQGEFFSDVSLMQGDHGELGWQLARINVNPTRLAVIDFIVHRPTFGLLRWETQRWGNITSFPETLEVLNTSADVPRLPNVDRVAFMGNALAASQNLEIENYPELLKFACASRGWCIEEMDVYRHLSQFPIQATMDAVLFTIPGSKTWPCKSK